MSAAKRIISKPLKDQLINIIRFRGPMTVADYMKIVLTNPESGFYMNDVFGVKGHFTTSPEISQMFGEIVGAWVMQEWHRFGCPRPLRLVEFGPGRGTLISDVARTICRLEKDFVKNIQISLIEMSPKLQDVQRNALVNLSVDLAGRTRWFSHIDALPRDEDGGFTAYLANEYIDTLPIHKFVRDPKSGAWRDLLIDYDAKNNLRFCISNKPSLASRLLIPDSFEGDHIEICAEGALQLEKVSKRMDNSRSGCMLVCDYGFEGEPEDLIISKENDNRALRRSSRDTFRAFKNHQPWPPLSEPGTADLTADVDFGYLKRNLADKATLFGSVTQGNFLLQCGLRSRLEILLENNQEEQNRRDLMSGADFLLQEMGKRFRFLAIFPKGSDYLFKNNPPAGFCDDNR